MNLKNKFLFIIVIEKDIKLVSSKRNLYKLVWHIYGGRRGNKWLVGHMYPESHTYQVPTPAKVFEGPYVEATW